MRYGKWLLLLLVLIGLVLLGVQSVKTYSLFNKGPEKADHIKVLEAERSPMALPHYIAMAQGFYREQELELESVQMKDIPDELKLDHGGDILLSNLSQSLFTRSLGTGAELVAFAGLARKDGTFLLGRENSEPFSWEQLNKKSILGDAPDQQSTILLEEVLKNKKFTLQRQVIIIQNIPGELKEGSFQAGVGAYVLMAEPLATITEESGLGKNLTALSSSVKPVPSLVFSAPPDYLKQHGREVQKLVNGLCKAMLWLDYHSPAEAASVVRTFFPGIKQQYLTKMIQRYKGLGLWGKSPLIAKEDYEQLQNYVRKAGELTNPVDYDEGVNRKFAKKAASSVEYVPPGQEKEKKWWEKIYP